MSSGQIVVERGYTNTNKTGRGNEAEVSRQMNLNWTAISRRIEIDAVQRVHNTYLAARLPR